MELSFWQLFWHADFVVKIVIFVLLGMSVWTWAVLFGKLLTLYRHKEANREFDKNFWSSEDLTGLYKQLKGREGLSAQARIFMVAMMQWSDRPGSASAREISTSILGRAERSMQQECSLIADDLESYVGTLANIASSAPFIGLFGTVWGVMNAFIAIGQTGNTSLASVAPGIAEALFATALGLVAAIPASIAYNALVERTGKAVQEMENYAQQFAVLLARQLEWS